jgi:hypothetical protein
MNKHTFLFLAMMMSAAFGLSLFNAITYHSVLNTILASGDLTLVVVNLINFAKAEAK